MAQACAHLCHQRRHLLMLVAMGNLVNLDNKTVSVAAVTAAAAVEDTFV